ncbi:MAG: hypothetical protein AAB152_13305 [Candidatus Coatesbacteria bacterium]
MRRMLLLAIPGILLARPVAAADEGKPTIAVMDFSPSNVPAGDAVIVSGFVRAAVVRCRKFTVVEKNNMDKVMAEQAFQQTGCTTSDCAVKVGRLLNTRKMVIGEFALLGGIRFLTASLVDVETGEIENTARVKGFEVATADEAADKLVSQLTGVAVAPGSEAMGAAPKRVIEPRVIEPYRPPRSYTRFGIGVSGEAVGYDFNMRFGLPWGGYEKADTHMNGQVLFTASLRIPVNQGGEMTAGFDAGFGIRPGPSSSARATYRLYPVPDAAGDPGDVFVLDAAAVAVAGLTGELGLKVGLGIVTARYPAIPFRYTSDPRVNLNEAARVGTLLGEVPAAFAASVVLRGGLEWFMTRHDVFEAQAELDVGGGGDVTPSGVNRYGIKYDSIRFGGGYKHYFGGGY